MQWLYPNKPSYCYKITKAAGLFSVALSRNSVTTVTQSTCKRDSPESDPVSVQFNNLPRSPSRPNIQYKNQFLMWSRQQKCSTLHVHYPPPNALR